MLQGIEVDFIVVTVDNRGHLCRHEKLPQLNRLRSSFFQFLGQKVVAQRLNDPGVTPSEPLYDFVVSQVGLLTV